MGVTDATPNVLHVYTKLRDTVCVCTYRIHKMVVRGSLCLNSFIMICIDRFDYV